jgi:hypothetical protein
MGAAGVSSTPSTNSGCEYKGCEASAQSAIVNINTIFFMGVFKIFIGIGFLIFD